MLNFYCQLKKVVQLQSSASYLSAKSYFRSFWTARRSATEQLLSVLKPFNEQKEKARFWCHSNCIDVSEKSSRNTSSQGFNSNSLFLGKHPKINNPISGLVRIINTAALPLQHLVARRQSSERVWTFKNTICTSLSQSFVISQSISTDHGQESRTCNKCPHKGHKRVESWRKVRPVFIPLLCFFTGSTTLWRSLAFALESLSTSYSHILSMVDTSFEPDISLLKGFHSFVT